ncbi:NAD(P)/FAD-dependent oxidoreductase [Rhodococcus sp. D2-41]|uniref:flavin-containing monooxygenase n=1 Tax=Speluncibacter jeojiensis TaxID=2710754 RepID=UPI00240F8B27|nr:NAD(P)/FAD-dependent oxidoreductase [Rhodococcus sp. D2-41]MDG3010581.1 NAD(P)/FAD-dependent oxidoreductase [Rhodococcus sp. D2-41]
MLEVPGPAESSPSVIVIGAGFAGIAAAIELIRAGHDDVTILEKSPEVGGVWRENTYPGAGCDVPSPYYSFSFEPRTDWPMRYSLQPDILDYIEDVVAEYGLLPRIRFGVEVRSARFDTCAGLWVVSATDGREFLARMLIPATGLLSRPAMPRIPGIGSFEGPAFHSARWDHDCDLSGKRVAVIGTGASAIQFVPAIQPRVAELTLFQRSAQYILPKPDREYRPVHHRAFRAVPALLATERLLWWTLGETWTRGITGMRGKRAVNAFVRRRALRHLRRQVPDARKRAQLTPDYEIGCKRVLFANTYYPAVCEPNVRIETAGVEEITPRGVRTADGFEHEVDVIIYGTGFTAQQPLAPMRIEGVDGVSLRDDVWSDGSRAYLGMTVPAFPNMFVMYGPNTNLGTGSIIYMLERQARYVGQAAAVLAAAPEKYLDVRADVEQRFDDEMQQRLAGTAWATCTSWYRAGSGRISANWPGLVSEYSRRTKRFDPADYVLRSAGVVSSPKPVPGGCDDPKPSLRYRA